MLSDNYEKNYCKIIQHAKPTSAIKAIFGGLSFGIFNEPLRLSQSSTPNSDHIFKQQIVKQMPNE